MAEAPVILFGACDRHNLGDLLLPHIAQALLAPRPVIVAGVAQCDLTPHGGHRVAAIARLAEAWGDRRADLIHVGGELLTCSLYEAAVMTLPPAEAAAAIARHDRDEAGRQRWAEQTLGLRQQLGYLAPKALFRQPGRFLHQAVGGVDLPRLPQAMRTEVLSRLRESEGLTLRDHVTQATLAQAGIRARLVPDPAVLAAELFGARIARHAAGGEPARVRTCFPRGYVALQFAAEFGDDATLGVLAGQLDQLAADTGLGFVLFRAGAAPWHDDLAVYRRLLGLMQSRATWLFASLDLWDLCALLAEARLYVGSSLHGRIVASAFGVPGVNLAPPGVTGGFSKQAAYLATWHADEACGVVSGADLSEVAVRVMAQDRERLHAHAHARVQLARLAASELIRALDPPPA